MGTPIEILAKKAASGVPLTPAELQLAVRALLQDWVDRNSGVPQTDQANEVTKAISSSNLIPATVEKIDSGYVVEITKDKNE